jgi:transposase
MEAQFRNVPDALWEQIAPIIPGRRKNTLRGRPPVPDREVLAVGARRISPHIRRIGEQPLLGCVQGKPRRWVVERTNAWHNRFRGLLVRWERIGAHYHGLLHLACALIAFRQAR